MTFDTTLLGILLATALSGIGSMAGAAVLSLTVLSRMVDRMVSFSVGVLLATSLLHSLPEAFEAHHGIEPNTHVLFATLLAGLLGFFLLEKISLIRHSHHHEGDGHGHHHGHDRQEAGRSGLMILVGDGLHNFSDGIVIAAAFLADTKVGIVTALAIAAHEIPQEIGDFMVLLNAGFSKTRAFVYNLICSVCALVGAVLGYYLLDRLTSWIPYVLVVASSSFIYIAVCDLMPQMKRRPRWQESAVQVALITAGIAMIFLLTEGFTVTHTEAPPSRSMRKSPVDPGLFAVREIRGLRVGPGRHRARRVAAPLAPRAGVECGARQARDLHGQRVVAGGHARATLQHRVLRFGAGQYAGKVGVQLRGGLEGAVGLQVVAEEAVASARDVAADGVERFVLATVAVGRAGIDDGLVGVAQVFLHEIGGHHLHERRLTGDVSRCGAELRLFGHDLVDGEARGFPGLQAAIEHGDIGVADPTQQPP